jgi:hypothetical protein
MLRAPLWLTILYGSTMQLVLRGYGNRSHKGIEVAGQAPGPAFRPDLWLTILFVGILIEGLAGDFDSGNNTGLAGFLRVVSGQEWITSSQRAASLL